MDQSDIRYCGLLLIHGRTHVVTASTTVAFAITIRRLPTNTIVNRASNGIEVVPGLVQLRILARPCVAKEEDIQCCAVIAACRFHRTLSFLTVLQATTHYFGIKALGTKIPAPVQKPSCPFKSEQLTIKVACAVLWMSTQHHDCNLARSRTGFTSGDWNGAVWCTRLYIVRRLAAKSNHFRMHRAKKGRC